MWSIQILWKGSASSLLNNEISIWKEHRSNTFKTSLEEITPLQDGFDLKNDIGETVQSFAYPIETYTEAWVHYSKFNVPKNQQAKKVNIVYNNTHLTLPLFDCYIDKDRLVGKMMKYTSIVFVDGKVNTCRSRKSKPIPCRDYASDYAEALRLCCVARTSFTVDIQVRSSHDPTIVYGNITDCRNFIVPTIIAVLLLLFVVIVLFLCLNYLFVKWYNIGFGYEVDEFEARISII